MTMPDDEDILGELFHGCALAAFVDQAIAERGPPDCEATRCRAYRYYEEALAAKNASRDGISVIDPNNGDTVD